MNKIIELSHKLREELDKLPLFIEYKSTKKEIENNIELKELKKLIVRAKNENRLEDQKELLQKYNSHPLVVNYNNLQNEVRDYLKEISDILNS